jgi:hypothetical protein
MADFDIIASFDGNCTSFELQSKHANGCRKILMIAAWLHRAVLPSDQNRSPDDDLVRIHCATRPPHWVTKGRYAEKKKESKRREGREHKRREAKAKGSFQAKKKAIDGKKEQRCEISKAQRAF